MNTSTHAIRFGLFVFTSALIGGTAALHGVSESSAETATASSATVSSATASQTPIPPNHSASTLTVLPTVRVRASEEEILAASIDPSDRIQIMAAITVTPSAEEIADAMKPDASQIVPGSDARGGTNLGAVLSNAVTKHHRLRLDMPYYSFGDVLARAQK